MAMVAGSVIALAGVAGHCGAAEYEIPTRLAWSKTDTIGNMNYIDAPSPNFNDRKEAG